MKLAFTRTIERVCSPLGRRTYLRSAAGEAHLCVLAGLRSERGQARGHGVLRPSRGTEVLDLRPQSVPGWSNHTQVGKTDRKWRSNTIGQQPAA